MWAETRTVPILSPSGDLQASLSITLDVTGSVLYQKQVEEKNKDLQDFTYMISHDLKSPIYTIKGMYGVLKEELAKVINNPEIIEPLEHINTASLRLEKLVANVLEYSKLSARDFPCESTDMNQILKEVLKDFEPKIKEENIKISSPENLPVVLSNKDALYQVFSNLIGNAIKYRSAQRPLEINISGSSSSNSRHTDITIRDNGSGIPNEKLSDIFRPFQRAHSNVEGSGIGLASVKKLLDKTGGQIKVSSNQNEFTEFCLTLRKFQ